MAPGWRRVALLSMLALLGTFAVYGQTVSYGFSYDDYHFVRPYSSAELAGAWSGSWDPTGIESPFYRPLTTAFMAARFEAFGVNATAYRWLTLAMFAATAALFGLWVLGVAGSTRAGILGTAWFCCYPTFAYSLTGWVMHQMHLLETLLVLGGLLWWWHCKSRPLRWWLPLLVLQLAAMLVKEDGAMLTLAILAVHGLYRVMIDPDVRPAPRVFVAAGLTALLGFVLARRAILGGMGGYGVPAWAEMQQNFAAGLERVFFQTPARRPGQALVSVAVRLLPLLAAWPLIRVSNRRFAFLGAAGVGMALLFNAPFIFVSKPEQYHLVGLGACFVLVACASSIAGVAEAPRIRAIVWAFAIAISPVFARVAIHAASDFAPCSARTLYTNAIVRDWGAVPAEIRAGLPTAAASCDAGAANPADLPAVVFGAWGFEDVAGVPARWTSGRVTVLVKPDTLRVRLPMRAMLGPLGGAPARVRARVGRHQVLDLVLSDERWRCPQIAVDVRSASPLKRSAVVELEVSPTWVPADELAGSTDRRALGIRLGAVGSTCPG
jgi:hypothetical protein